MFEEFLDRFPPKDREVVREVLIDNVYQIQPTEIKGRVVLDLGANVGIFSLLCCLLGAKHCYAYEMSEINYGELQNNIDRFFLRDRITAFNYAVYPYLSIVPYIEKNNKSHISLEENNLNVKKIKTWDLNNICESFKKSNYHNLILKADIEGAEYDVLFGLNNIYLRMFSFIFLESHDLVLSSLLSKHICSFGFRSNKISDMFITSQDKGTQISGTSVLKFIRINRQV